MVPCIVVVDCSAHSWMQDCKHTRLVRLQGCERRGYRCLVVAMTTAIDRSSLVSPLLQRLDAYLAEARLLRLLNTAQW